MASFIVDGTFQKRACRDWPCRSPFMNVGTFVFQYCTHTNARQQRARHPAHLLAGIASPVTLQNARLKHYSVVQRLIHGTNLCLKDRLCAEHLTVRHKCRVSHFEALLSKQNMAYDTIRVSSSTPEWASADAARREALYLSY